MPLAALALGWLLGGGAAGGVEGKWTPEQVLDHDPAWLRSLGLELPPGRLWRYLLWVPSTLEGEAARPLLREIFPPG